MGTQCNKKGPEYVPRGQGVQGLDFLKKRSEYIRALRLETMKKYSKGKVVCKCCGEDKFEFLVIDHIDGCGNKKRKKEGVGYAFYLFLRRNNYPKGYRVLCYNCNAARQIYGKCPHNNKI